MTEPVTATSAPAPEPVVITFEFTFGEVYEGLMVSPEARRQLRVHSGAVAVVLAGLVLILLGLLFLLLSIGSPPATPVVGAPPPVTSRVDVWLALTPSWAAAGIVATALLMSGAVAWASRARTERGRRMVSFIGTACMVVLFGTIWAALHLMQPPPTPNTWMLERGPALVLAVAPWIALLVGSLLLVRHLGRTQVRRDWETKPYLWRRRTITFDASGERVVDEKVDMLYRWPYFRRAWETQNVLVLEDENSLRHILPKRVMDQTTLDLARAVISNNVSDCKFLTTPGGFPVAALAALPADSTPPQAT